MKNKFDAISNPDEKDGKFLIEIISQICDYAVDNNMNTNDTVKIIANNMLMILEIANFNNWDRRGENER